MLLPFEFQRRTVSSNKNRPRPVRYSVSTRAKLARSVLRRILPGLSLQEPRRGVLAAGFSRGWASGWAACRGRPLSRAAARVGAVRSIFGQEKKDGPRPRSVGVASPEALRGATPSLLACPRKGKVRPANPVRGATRSPKIGGRQGVDNPKP